jgi:23S rRNA (uracil747-C5)-methyltransferase
MHSEPTGFRDKAKMVVLGSADNPKLGIINHLGQNISLCNCPHYPNKMKKLLGELELWLRQLAIAPYEVKNRQGELKFLLLNRNSDNQYMLRLVLRSKAAIATIDAALPSLLSNHPDICSVSVNIQAIPMAIIEGPEEHILSGDPWLRHHLNGINLYQRPKGFFQTNLAMAATLYATAKMWTAELEINTFWDLFCGSGGFGLHCLTPNRQLIGIEIEAEAIACAQRSAEELGLGQQVHFQALDSTLFATENELLRPQLIITNPPRRGLGNKLCAQINQIAPNYLLYSSCNANTLAADLSALNGYRIERIQLFDMFPHTAHYEVLVLLSRV